jgi:hypothetical protein
MFVYFHASCFRVGMPRLRERVHRLAADLRQRGGLAAALEGLLVGRHDALVEVGGAL